jgi:hypothetical protein
MKTTLLLTVLAGVILSALRLTGTTSLAFQAAAHLVVGLCIGIAVGEKRWRFAAVAIALTVVEVVAFFVVQK